MKHCKQTFTLIELLVVICIIAILASMLLPALQSARESASTATCISNLGQFSKAFQMYTTSFNDYMPALTEPQTGSCGWERALTEAIGQDAGNNADMSDVNPPFKSAFFCDADASSETAAVGGKKKSYSLNNLQEAIHPRIPNMLLAKGKEGKGTNNKGYISGNKSTSVFTPSDLIIIGENASESNTIGKASFSTTSVNSPGSASAPQQFIALRQRLSSHSKKASELFLDGHAKHMAPEDTLTINIKGMTGYSDKPSNVASKAWGSWTDCNYRKVGKECPNDTTCRKE